MPSVKPNRIIVFKVAGVIKLESPLDFSKNLTIAAQTAPGDGVVVYGNRVSFSGADNLICRYLRVRMGINGREGKDAAGIAYGSDMIFDHMSVHGDAMNVSPSMEILKARRPASEYHDTELVHRAGIATSFLWWAYPDHNKRWSYFVPESVYRQ